MELSGRSRAAPVEAVEPESAASPASSALGARALSEVEGPAVEGPAGSREPFAEFSPSDELLQLLTENGGTPDQNPVSRPPLDAELKTQVRSALLHFGEIAGVDLSGYLIADSPYPSPMNINTTHVARSLGEQATLFVREVASADWVLPHEVAHAVHEELGGVDLAFLQVVGGLGASFPPLLARSADGLTLQLREAFTDGTGIALIEAGASFSLPQGSSVAILERACEAFVSLVGSGEYARPDEEPEFQAYQLARQIAAAEMLFNRALAAGMSGEPLVALRDARAADLERLQQVPLAEPDQQRLLKLFRLATQAGAELPLDREPSPLSPSISALLRECGTHAASLGEYVQALMSTFRGEGSPEACDWLPGGRQFEEIERGRAQWGSAPFSYNSAHELPPEVAAEIFSYYRTGKSDEQAMSLLEQFVKVSYSGS